MKIYLRQKIPLLIVAPTLLAVILIIFFGYRTGKKAVARLANQSSLKSTQAIEEHLENYLDIPHNLLAFNQAAIESGQIDPNDLRNIGDLAFQLVPEKARAYFYGTEEGEFVGIKINAENPSELLYSWRTPESAPNTEIYTVDEQGKPDQLQTLNLYDPRERPWYQKAAKVQKPTWSDIYVFTGENAVLGVSAASPYYNNAKQLQGVFIIDILLEDIDHFLSNLTISPTGEAFIIEPNGVLVGNSLEVPSFQENEEEQERLNAVESENVILSQITKAFFEKHEGKIDEIENIEQFQVQVEGSTQYVGVTPFRDGRGIEWLVFVVIPERDFQYIIHASTRSALFVGCGLAVVGGVLGLLIARSIVQPIESLNNAAQAIEENQFDPQLLASESQRQDEIGQLATVFQRMGKVIMANQASLKEQMSELEHEVAKAKQQSQNSRNYDNTSLKDLLKRSRQLRQQQGLDSNISQMLRQVPYFRSLSEEFLTKLIQQGEKQVFSEKQYIFREDEPGDTFYIILEGAVEVYVENISKFLTQLSTGSFFGELSLLLGVPRTATVRTTENTILFALSQANFKKFLDQYPKEQQPNFLNAIAEQMKQHQEEIASRQEFIDNVGSQNKAGDQNIEQNPLNWMRNRLNALFLKS